MTEDLAAIAREIQLQRLQKQQMLTHKSREEIEKLRHFEQSRCYKCLSGESVCLCGCQLSLTVSLPVCLSVCLYQSACLSVRLILNTLHSTETLSTFPPGCGAVMRVVVNKIGEDWIFLFLLGCIMAMLSFLMDFCILHLLEGEADVPPEGSVPLGDCQRGRSCSRGLGG